MRPIPILLLALASSPPPPDNSPEAYRLDALRTKALNEAAIDRLRLAPLGAVSIAAPPAPTPAEIELARRERRAIDDWRARRAACVAGRRSACD